MPSFWKTCARWPSTVRSFGGVTVPSCASEVQIAADRFAVAGDLQLDLWYVGEQWVKLAFPGPDGTPIDYRLQRSDRPLVATAS